ncbi:hypothetical protein CK203_016338 [Vitis vinifera]|uniref:DUF4283 domain-containing protein n=1 Tax=Vitis vinifera TaxID=29760 RepID=A0A438J121_VITVI|nr:hypothetical protein CK203_016338 [Vitis vinifera]
MGRRVRPVGRVRTQIQFGAKTGLQLGSMHRVGWVCWAKHHLLAGLKLTFSTGPSPLGLVCYGNGNGKPKEKVGPLGLLKRDGPAFRSTYPPVSSKAQKEKGSSAMERSPLRGPDVGISNCWGRMIRRRKVCSVFLWNGDFGPFSSFLFLFWSDSKEGVFRPFWNFSGVNQGDCLCKEIGHSQQAVGKCWDLVEISNDSMEDDRKALCLARPISQEEGAWVEERWEESDLARKRRERIHSKAMLEKSKFERELRRLECSVNYEGGKKRKGSNRRDSNLLGQRTLEILEMEMGQFTISCRLRNVEDGKTWIFTGVYGPFPKEDRDTFWGELGAIRGIWDDPWCVGGDFNVTLNLGERSNQGRLTGAMRKFAQVTDELELLDIPLHGGGGFLEWGKE